MSVFSTKLKDFLSNSWDNPVDIALNNQLIKQRGNILNDQGEGQQFISNFIASNTALIATASEDFQDGINELVNYITEVVYDGYWEMISLRIRDKFNKIIQPDVMARIKKMALEQYGRRVVEDSKAPNKALILAQLDLNQHKGFTASLQAINPNLTDDVITLPNKNFNIANKINKMNSEKENKQVMEETNNIEQAIWQESVMQVATGYEGMEESMSLEEMCDKANKMLEEEKFAVDSDTLKEFVSKNAKKLGSILEGVTSSIDNMRLIALLENTTADMSVPEMAVTSSVIKRRLQNFDPYGKNLANTSGDTKTVIKFDDDVLKESLDKTNINKMFISGTDLKLNKKFVNVIFECEGKNDRVVIDKEKFTKFVSRNVDTKNYMKESKFDADRYFQSRPIFFIHELLKEYFQSIKEGNELPDFNIDDVQIDESQDRLTIMYYYDTDEEDRVIKTKLSAFVDYVSKTQDFGYDFDEYWNTIGITERYAIVKSYMLSRGVGKTMMREAAIKDQTNDYNDWKDKVATATNSDYKIVSDKEGSINSFAVDDSGKKVGEWIPNKRQGYIYK